MAEQLAVEVDVKSMTQHRTAAVHSTQLGFNPYLLHSHLGTTNGLAKNIYKKARYSYSSYRWLWELCDLSLLSKANNGACPVCSLSVHVS